MPDGEPNIVRLLGCAEPAAASFAASAATEPVQTVICVPMASVVPMKSRPTSSTETPDVAVEMPRPGAESSAVISAPLAVFCASSDAVMVSVSPSARLLPEQLAVDPPNDALPLAPEVVHETPLTFALANA